MRFNISQSITGCPAGFHQARRLFEPNRDYDLREIIAAGLAPEHVLWLVLTRAEHDVEVRAAVGAGIERCCNQIGLVATADPQAIMLRLVQRYMRLHQATRGEAMQWIIEQVGA